MVDISPTDYKYSAFSNRQPHRVNRLYPPDMQTQLRQSNDGSGNGSVSDASDATSTARTPRKLIVQIASTMVTHLRTVPAIKTKPELVLEMNKLCDFETLYNLALVESRENFTKDTKSLVIQVLQHFKLTPQDLGDRTMVYVQNCVQTIMQVFKDRVFNK